MPAPRVFVSSTCYDLKYIRENLKFFIRNLGYEPVLSEEGAVFYDPSLNIQDACLVEVPASQLFVLIIGGRYGGKYKETEKSITNAEYQEAVKSKIPIFTLVERSVHEHFRLFLSNKENKSLDPRKITYPAVDSTKIFDFIEEVQGQSINNALFPFSDFEEIQHYLKQQWSGMLYRFLTTEGEAKRVGDLFSSLSSATANIEFLTRQVVKSVGDNITKTTIEFYDLLLGYEVYRDLAIWGLHPSPKSILENETIDKFCNNKIEVMTSDDYGNDSLTYGGPPYVLGKNRLERNKKNYNKIREELINRLKEKSISVEEFIKN
jgi:hypothetical protein